MLPARTEVSSPGPASEWTAVVAPVKARFDDYLHLTKARLSAMVVVSGVVGYWLAASAIDPRHLLLFTVATFLVVGGANAFNQILEREPDARMERTASRPIPSGRIGVSEAVVAASLMSLSGLLVLFLESGALTGALALGALVVYTLVYTPLKTRSSWATFAGAVSGAIPTLMGWSAAAGELAPLSLCLFGIVFFWQFPHTWAIAATYRSDFERVGNRALPRRGLALGCVASTLALVATSLVPSVLGSAGLVYSAGALGLGAFLLGAAVRFGNGTERRRAASLLAVSLFYLPLILALAAFDGRVG